MAAEGTASIGEEVKWKDAQEAKRGRVQIVIDLEREAMEGL